MPIGVASWRNRLRSHLHPPRTVRMRLTLLCGGVIVLSGGTLIGIAFALGGTGPSKQQVRYIAHQAGVAINVLQSASPASGTVIFAGGPETLAGTTGGSGQARIFQAAQSAARLGSSGSIHDLLLWSLVGLGVVTAIGLGLGWGLSGRMLRPLRTMRSTAQHISEENLHERLALSGPAGDELRDLGDTIDGLLARLEAAFEARRRFVQNAAHELRTPITMMRTSLEVATAKPEGAPPEVHVLAGKLGEGLDQAERLLEGFLTLACAEAGAVADDASVDLSDAVSVALEERAEVVASLGLRIERALGPATASGSTTLLPQIVVNLIDNAIRHNESGGLLRVTTATDGDLVRLVVENDGERVEQSRVDELGQPFHRLVDRTASDRGSGLGLSIVRAIVRAGGGTLWLRARDTGGLLVTVELPAANALALAGAR